MGSCKRKKNLTISKLNLESVPVTIAHHRFISTRDVRPIFVQLWPTSSLMDHFALREIMRELETFVIGK